MWKWYIENRAGGGGWDYSTLSKPPAARFASQDDAHVKTDTQIKFLHYSLILPSDQRRVIKQAKFTNSRLTKALEKQTKTI